MDKNNFEMSSIMHLDQLIELVSKKKNNPFVLWPGVSREKISLYLFNQLQQERVGNKEIYFEENNRIYLYFQIHNLNWDSNHFGFGCALIKNYYIDEEIDFVKIDIILKKIIPIFNNYISNENIRFLSADIESQNKNGNYFIHSLGFRFILNWIDGIWIPKILEKGEFDNFIVNPILPEEVGIISDIAKTSYYKEGRFYSDKKFDVINVDKLYGALVVNSYENKDIILVCHDGKIPIGAFISKQIKEYHDFNNLRVAHLRFLVVDSNYRGKNIGFRVFRSTLEYLRDKSDLITTGLEAHNLISLNLHNKLGFKYNFSHNAFHFWKY